MRVFLLLAAGALALSAQTRFEFWPGASYDSAIPTEKQVLGHDPGERIAPHREILQYMEALQAAAPKRVKIFEYARTWEGRKLVYVAVGSEANIRRLDAIEAGMKKLADPRRTNQADAQKLIGELPAVIWLAYGVHGNEISSPDAALETAYHLLASRNDKLVEEILSKVVVLIDPLQNPDGRDRFVHNFEVAEGLRPDPSQMAAEHNEPWPGGRTNHYYFDMNRDWFAMTQPETRGRLKAVLQWFPLIFTDLHEMGSDSTYYFTPEADPFNPFITKTQRDSLEWFGRNNAKWFDKFGFNWFTKENYDEFYPGYGASWPLYHGSIAMTYEQASTRGLVVKKSDGEVVSYRDTVRRHFVASISTAETAAHNREKLLTNFYEYRKSAVEEGTKDSIREYILPRTGDVSTVDRLAGNLSFQGVEVRRATAGFNNSGRDYPAGSYTIALAQPSKRLIRTLLDPQVKMEDWFLKAEEKRRLARQPSEMYDVTAWSLPLQYNVEAVAAAEVSKGSFETIPAEYRPAGKVVGAKPEVAYLIPWGISASAKFLSALLQEDVRVLSTDKAFKQDGRTYPSGTLVIKVKDNPANVGDTVARLAQQTGAEVFTTDSGWVDDGPNFGSRYMVTIPKIKVAIAWDQPTSAGSAGATRFLLERQYGCPVTVVRTQQLASGDLRDFNVIVLPDAGFGAGYDAVLGANGARRLKDWVQNGGTLIAMGPGAVSYLADPKVGMLAISQENVVREAEKKPATPATPPATGSARTPGKLIASEQELAKSIQPDSELPDSLHGVLLRAKVDPESWATAGMPESVNVLMSGRSIYTPVKLDKGVNAVYFAGPEQIVASGYMWEENRKQLAFKPFEVVQRDGRGSVIGFTADPNFRGYMDGLHLLFLNAVFRGPAHTQGGRGGGAE
jgi:hypothetical protein